MPGQYIITEPSPSTTSYIRSGRGGAGNIVRSSNTHGSNTSAATTKSARSQTTPARRFFSGVGGAGNAHEASERPVLSLDDEVRRLAAQQEAAVGHCGIGGAGNVYRRKASDASSSDDARSDVSDASSIERAKLWARNAFSRD